MKSSKRSIFPLAAVNLGLLGLVSNLPSTHAAAIPRDVLTPHGFHPDGLSVADIILLCIYIPLFSFFAYRTYQVRKLNAPHIPRAPYTALLFACIYIVIRHGLWLGVVIQENTLPDNFENNFTAQEGLITASYFFALWSYILLYGAYALLMADRYLRITQAGADSGPRTNSSDNVHQSAVDGDVSNKAEPRSRPRLFKSLIGLLSGLMVLATMTSIFTALSYTKTNGISFAGFILLIVFFTVWGAVTLYQIALMIYMHRYTIRCGKRDSITHITLKFISPICFLGMVFAATFTIVPFELLDDLFIYVPFAIMISMMLFWARQGPGLWAVVVVSSNDETFHAEAPSRKPRRTGEYIEMVDPVGVRAGADTKPPPLPESGPRPDPDTKVRPPPASESGPNSDKKLNFHEEIGDRKSLAKE